MVLSVIECRTFHVAMSVADAKACSPMLRAWEQVFGKDVYFVGNELLQQHTIICTTNRVWKRANWMRKLNNGLWWRWQSIDVNTNCNIIWNFRYFWPLRRQTVIKNLQPTTNSANEHSEIEWRVSCTKIASGQMFFVEHFEAPIVW